MTPEPLRASLYVRLSKTADDRNLSKSGMIADLRKLCESLGAQEVALHVDDGKSGAIRDRRALRAWLADAVEGRANLLLTWHTDRLTREGVNAAAMVLDVLEGKDSETGKKVEGRKPVRLVSYDDRLDSASDDDSFRLNFLIKAEFARAELKRIKSRARSRVRRQKAEKKSTGGLTPYGYQRARKGSAFELEHDPVSAPILQDMVSRVIGGESILSVSNDLNARGVLSPRDHAALRDMGEPRKDKETGEPKPLQAWTDQTVRRMLTNPVLLGRLTDERKIVRDADGKPVLRGEPLIFDADWNALQDAINGAKRPKYRKAPDALLSGVAFCSDCGELLHFHWAVRPTQEYRYYRCSGRTRKGNGCKAGAPRAEALERLTSDTLLGVVGDLDVMRKVFVPGDDTATELADVEARMADLRSDRAEGLYKGEKGTAEFREMYGPLEARREALEAQPSKPGGWEYISTGQTYRQLWEASDTIGRRRLLVDAGFRVEAVKAGNAVSIGLFERPEGYAASALVVNDGVQLGLYLPGDLAARVSGNPKVKKTVGRQRPLPAAEMPGRVVEV